MRCNEKENSEEKGDQGCRLEKDGKGREEREERAKEGTGVKEEIM
jgi:hypothetical protein